MEKFIWSTIRDLLKAVEGAEQKHYECATARFLVAEVALILAVIGYNSKTVSDDDQMSSVHIMMYQIVGRIYRKLFDEEFGGKSQVNIVTIDKQFPKVRSEVYSILTKLLPMYIYESGGYVPGESTIDFDAYKKIISDLRIFRSLPYENLIQVFLDSAHGGGIASTDVTQEKLTVRQFKQAIERLMLNSFLLSRRQKYHVTQGEFFEPISAKTGWTPQSISFRVLLHRLRILGSLYPPSSMSRGYQSGQKPKSYLQQSLTPSDKIQSRSLNVSQTISQLNKRSISNFSGQTYFLTKSKGDTIRWDSHWWKNDGYLESFADADRLDKKDITSEDSAQLHEGLDARQGSEKIVDKKVKQHALASTSSYDRSFHYHILYENSCSHSFNLYEACGNIVTPEFKQLTRKLFDRHFERHSRKLSTLQRKNLDGYRHDTAMALYLALRCYPSVFGNCCKSSQSLESFSDTISAMHGKLLDLFRSISEIDTTMKQFYHQWTMHIGTPHAVSSGSNRGSLKEENRPDTTASSFDDDDFFSEEVPVPQESETRHLAVDESQASASNDGISAPRERRHSAPGVQEKRSQHIYYAQPTTTSASPKSRHPSIASICLQQEDTDVSDTSSPKAIPVLSKGPTTPETKNNRTRGGRRLRQCQSPKKTCQRQPKPPVQKGMKKGMSSQNAASFHVSRLGYEKQLQKYYDALIRRMVDEKSFPAHLYKELNEYMREQDLSSKATRTTNKKCC